MPVGICTGMCPEKEILDREQGKRLHVLEMKVDCDFKKPIADPDKCVKEYVRSAAGKDKLEPSTLRTPQALLKTTKYLLDIVLDIKKHHRSLLVTTNFISDRLRCVRQDIIIQQLQWQYAVPLLERIIRYHIYLMKALHYHDSQRFDPVINYISLNSYLSDLFEYYSLAEQCGGDLQNRSEFISYYILLNLRKENNVFYLRLITTNDKRIYELNFELLTIKKLLEAYIESNFYRFFKIVNKLTYLQACCLIGEFTPLRLSFLKQLNNAFSSKIIKFEVDVVQKWLVFDTLEQTLKFLLLFELCITTDNNHVIFDKKKVLNKLTGEALNNFRSLVTYKILIESKWFDDWTATIVINSNGRL